MVKHTYNHCDGCLKIAVASVMLPMMKTTGMIMVMLLMVALVAIMATVTVMMSMRNGDGDADSVWW